MYTNNNDILRMNDELMYHLHITTIDALLDNRKSEEFSGSGF